MQSFQKIALTTLPGQFGRRRRCRHVELSRNVLVNRILEEERFDLLADELGAKAAPVDLEPMVVAGQEVSLMRHAR